MKTLPTVVFAAAPLAAAALLITSPVSAATTCAFGPAAAISEPTASSDSHDAKTVWPTMTGVGPLGGRDPATADVRLTAKPPLVAAAGYNHASQLAASQHQSQSTLSPARSCI